MLPSLHLSCDSRVAKCLNKTVDTIYPLLTSDVMCHEVNQVLTILAISKSISDPSLQGASGLAHVMIKRHFGAVFYSAQSNVCCQVVQAWNVPVTGKQPESVFIQAKREPNGLATHERECIVRAYVICQDRCCFLHPRVLKDAACSRPTCCLST